MSKSPFPASSEPNASTTAPSSDALAKVSFVSPLPKLPRQQFPFVFARMVQDLTQLKPDLFSWTTDGRALQIKGSVWKNEEAILKAIRPYFGGWKSSKSLFDNLRRWGWSREKRNEEDIEYNIFYHERFHRDALTQDNLKLIKVSGPPTPPKRKNEATNSTHKDSKTTSPGSWPPPPSGSKNLKKLKKAAANSTRIDPKKTPPSTWPPPPPQVRIAMYPKTPSKKTLKLKKPDDQEEKSMNEALMSPNLAALADVAVFTQRARDCRGEPHSIMSPLAVESVDYDSPELLALALTALDAADPLLEVSSTDVSASTDTEDISMLDDDEAQAMMEGGFRAMLEGGLIPSPRKKSYHAGETNTMDMELSATGTLSTIPSLQWSPAEASTVTSSVEPTCSQDRSGDALFALATSVEFWLNEDKTSSGDSAGQAKTMPNGEEADAGVAPRARKMPR